MGKPLSTSEIDIYILTQNLPLKIMFLIDDSKSSIIDKIILLKYNIFIENQLTAWSFYPLKVYIFYFSFTASI